MLTKSDHIRLYTPRDKSNYGLRHEGSRSGGFGRYTILTFARCACSPLRLYVMPMLSLDHLRNRDSANPITTSFRCISTILFDVRDL